MNKKIISVVLLGLMAACSSNPKVADTNTAQKLVNKVVKAATAKIATDPLNDANSLLAVRSVYYPLDAAAVQEADKPAVAAHAQYLYTHGNRTVRLEGNCDERGSNEYNLALGQRRADGVKKMLQAGGANANQVTTVSYGEEKPAATAHDEASWKQNRRTDLNYTAK